MFAKELNVIGDPNFYVGTSAYFMTVFAFVEMKKYPMQMLSSTIAAIMTLVPKITMMEMSGVMVYCKIGGYFAMEHVHSMDTMDLTQFLAKINNDAIGKFSYVVVFQCVQSKFLTTYLVHTYLFKILKMMIMKL